MPELPRNPELERLIGCFTEEVLDEQKAARLDELIRELIEDDPAWKSEIWRQILVDAQLKDISKCLGQSPTSLDVISDLNPADHFFRDKRPVASSFEERRKFAYVRVRYVAIAAVLLFSLAVGLLIAFQPSAPLRENQPLPPLIAHEEERSPEIVSRNVVNMRPEARSSAAALLKIASQVVWENENEKVLQTGQVLEPGWLRFRSGIVVIDFFNGASVSLEGPADFQIISINKAFCSKGRIVVEVPSQAVGFQIDVPQMHVVDLGTSFSLDVSDKETLIHVLDGEVELHSHHSGKELLQLGDAVLANNVGQLDRITAPPFSAVSPSRLIELRQQQEHLQFERWKKQSESLLSDPSLLVRFDFIEKNNRSRYVPNIAPAGKQSTPNGLMIDCRIAEGRWKEKGAIEFKRISDRMRFDVPGEFESLTLAAWVRADGIERMYNSILTTDGFSEGEVHWQIIYDGKIELGVNTGESKPVVQLQTPSIITPLLIGHWIHLAVVVDAAAGEVVHYLNGEPVQRHEFRMPRPIRFKNLQLGNWTVDPTWPEQVHPIRHFSGAIDDFLLFSRPLSAGEIGNIYNNEFRFDK